MLFSNISEDSLCVSLKALVEEWGPDLIEINAPVSWKQYSDGNDCGRVKLIFCTQDTLEIIVKNTTIKIIANIQARVEA